MPADRATSSATTSSATLAVRVPARRATVFGLDVYADAPVELLGCPSARPVGRPLSLHVAAPGEPAPAVGKGELLCDERTPDGAVNFQIERIRGGHLLWGPRYGAHLLSGDARALQSFPGSQSGREWQRLLVAQALPLAALLRGLEVLHAGAVVLDGEAVALLGPSGAGKTSVALELCRLDAKLLADDVLAVQTHAGRLHAHPGTPVAAIDRDELARARARATAAEGSTSAPPSWERAETSALWENERECLIGVEAAGAPAPLGAMIFLERRADGPPQPRFAPVSDPRLLLSATFNFVQTDPARLSRLLEVCSLAAAGRVERVVVGPAVGAAGLAHSIVRRLRGEHDLPARGSGEHM